MSQFDSPPLPERKEIVNSNDLEVTSNSINEDTKRPDNECPNLPPKRAVPILHDIEFYNQNLKYEIFDFTIPIVSCFIYVIVQDFIGFSHLQS